MDTGSGFKEKIKGNLIPIILGVVGIGLVVFAVINQLSKKDVPQNRYAEITENKLENCETKVEKYVVDGGTDIFMPGAEIEVEMNFFGCKKGERDDIVMIRTPGRDQPLIKYIKMIPGDKFQIKQEKDLKYRVLVNGKKMENSKGEEYEFSDRKIRMIQLYESNFKDGIKEDVYFVFGDAKEGGFDSTRFGPVMPDRLIGKVLTRPGSERMLEPPKGSDKVDSPVLVPKDEPVAKPAVSTKPKVPAKNTKPAANKKTNAN